MSKEILEAVRELEQQKSIDAEVLLVALEEALGAAYRKTPESQGKHARVEIDRDTGDFRVMQIDADDEQLEALGLLEYPLPPEMSEIPVAEPERPRRERPAFYIRADRDPDPIDNEPDAIIEWDQLAQHGIIAYDATPKNFGRIAAQTAKQTMMQRLRQAEKEMIYDEFKDRAGDIVSGTVRRFERGDVYIDLGKFEGVMNQRERVSTEEYNVGDRVRAYVVAVENGARGPEIILSRSHPNFVRRLFESEVSEIADRTVEIRSLAREAGYRTKVAVYSADEKVDPVGACVGLRGARVKNIVRELNNEKVDIIRWSDDIRLLVTEALKPAEIKSITVDEAKKSVLVKVDEEELSKAIGRRGQNARLTARLTGWDVQVQKDESAHEAFEAQVAGAANAIAKGAGIEQSMAIALVRSGLNSLEILANDVDEVDIAGILDIPVEEAREIRNRAVVATGGTVAAAPAPVADEEPAVEVASGDPAE
jgi:N utilization substance protein A